MKILVCLVVASLGLSGSALASEPMSIKEITASPTCRPSNVSVLAYLHASRHGSWLSGDPGFNGKALLFTFGDENFPGREKTLNYMFRPQVNLHNSFHALFSGAITCNAHGKRILDVHKVDNIQLYPIRDAS